MTDTPIDPAATPEDDDLPEIAADDAGASALAERAQKQADDAEEDEARANRTPTASSRPRASRWIVQMILKPLRRWTPQRLKPRWPAVVSG